MADMTDDGVDDVIRRAIGGNRVAMDAVAADAATTSSALVVTMGALLGRDVSRLDRARAIAVSRSDRQVVEIARAHLCGDRDLVSALARDHLVDHPDSLIVAWIASGAHAVDQQPGPN